VTAPLRVAHVLHSLAVGGTENGVVNLIGRLVDIHHEVVCMTEAGPLASRLPADVPVHVIGKRSGIDLRAIVRLVLLLRRLRPDIVHTRNWAAFDAVPAARLARVPRLIHGEHGREIGDPHGRNRRRNAVRRASGPLVDRFVTVSHDLQRWLVETVGVPAKRVTTIHNGVDTTRFTPAMRGEARLALGVADDEVIIGTVGRLDPVKDQLSLIEATAVLSAAFGRVRAVLVGEGPSRPMLEARIRRLSLESRVTLLGERKDVPQLLPGFDVFVLPSIAEGISNTILEAMASGVPVIATRTGGNPELLEDGISGALVPIGDRIHLAGVLHRYVVTRDLRARHGAAARRRAVEHFGLDRMVSAYRALYMEHR